MGHLAAPTMAGCRLMWPDTCRRWLPVWLPGIGGASGGQGIAVDHGGTGDLYRAGSSPLPGMAATMAAKITVVLDDDLDVRAS
jgi:hypothetical protein